MGLITKLPGVVSAEKLDDKRLRIHCNGGLDVQEKILAGLVGINIGVVSFQPTSSALEEVVPQPD